MNIKMIPVVFLMVCPVMFCRPATISQYDIEKALDELQQTVREQYGSVKEITQDDLWKQHLKNECKINFSGCKVDQCYQWLNEIFKCESTWRQFDETGKPLRSSGNIGISQINIIAHEVEYTKLGLDIFNDPLDNISYAIRLYKAEGIKPWKEWSGHCFIPNLNYNICNKK